MSSTLLFIYRLIIQKTQVMKHSCIPSSLWQAQKKHDITAVGSRVGQFLVTIYFNGSLLLTILVLDKRLD